MTSLYPLALLMDELKHEDVANRVAAMQKIDTIAAALGPERTAGELLPFLLEVTQDDEDEVFAVLAERLPLLAPLIPDPSGAALLPIGEALASMEEPAVRDAAVALLATIAAGLSDAQLAAELLPLLGRLATGEWFSLRVAACGLYAPVLARVDGETRDAQLAQFGRLITDEAPMVRRAAAAQLSAVVRACPGNAAVWSAFAAVVQDDQDLVKFLGVDALVALLDTTQGREADLLEAAVRLAHDPLWRVRYMTADKWDALASRLAAHTQQLEPHFVGLMKDAEAEVRRAAARQVAAFAALLGLPARVVTLLVPHVDALAEDASEQVRALLALELAGLAPILGEQATLQHLLPIYTQMLKDEFPEVRLNIISKLNVVNEVIGLLRLSLELLPSIKQLADDKQWRVRLAIIEYIPLLLKQLGVHFFDQELGRLCMLWLWDPVFSIRDAAVTNLERLAETFGPEWARTELVGRILTGDDTPGLQNFVFRITCLFALTKLVPALGVETVVEDVLPFVDKLAADHVPNIRFNAAKSYAVVAARLADESRADVVRTHIVPKLETLVGDEDVDVRYFASVSGREVAALAG